MEGTLNLHNLMDEKTRNNQLEWAQKLFQPLNLKDKDNPRTTKEIISDEASCPSPLHGVFLNALIHLPTSTHGTEERMSSHQQILNQIMTKDVNKGVQSMVSELIQNSVDMGAGIISIEISEEFMTFTHDGSNDDGTIFSPKQLSYLFSMNTSTKMGDFTKIGQFGVGFKYWWWFFEEVEVIVDDGKFHHSLSLRCDFEPDETEYTYKPSDDIDASFTKFRFTKPRKDKTQKVKWTEYVRNEGTDIYGDRVFRSLPFIQARTKSDFEINLKSPIATSKLFCKLINSEKYDGFVLDTIEWGRSQGTVESNISTNYRVSTTLDEMKKSDKTNFDNFRDYVIDAYRESKTLQKLETEDFEKVVSETADEAINQSRINLLISPNETFTYPANLFVANSIDSKMSCAFYSDAPWQMEQNRVKLNMDTETPKRAWNFIMARFVDRLYSRFMSHCLNDPENLGFSSAEMFELINRPIGSKSLLSHDTYPLDDWFSKLYAVVLDDKTIILGHRINHIKDTFSISQKNNIGVANEALADLWYKLQKDEPGNEKARKWLNQALHENLAKVKLANNEYVPVTETLAMNILNPFSVYKRFDNEKLKNPPVICRNIGKGIPKNIKELLQKSNFTDFESLTEEKKELWQNQLALFDDVVRDSKKRLSFANDGKKIICDVPIEDELAILKSCLEILESDSEETILHFLSNTFYNVKQHKSHLGVSKHSLPKALDFEKAMEKLLIYGFETSLENESLKQSTVFKNWLNENTSTRVWNDVVLLKTPGKDYPTLVKLPPKAHMLCVVIGLNGKRHLESIKVDPLDHTEPEIKLHDDKPQLYHWGRKNTKQVYVTPSHIGPIEDLFNPWENAQKTPKLDDSENWGWSDMSPFGNTGWTWPVVNINIEDEETKANIITRMTPIFIDGLHVKQGTTFAGVHRGFRMVDEELKPLNDRKDSREPLNHMANGPSSADNAIEIVHLNFLRKSKIDSFDLLSSSIDHVKGSKYFPYNTKKSGPRVIIDHAVSLGDKEFEFNLKPHGQIRVLGLMSALIEHHKFRSEDESERQISYNNLQSISQRLNEYSIKYQSKALVYDVPLMIGGTEKKLERRQIGLIGAFIPHEKYENKNFIDDTGAIRLRSSDRFDELRNQGLSGYFSGKLSRPTNVIEFVREEFKNKTWLPRFCPDLIGEDLPESFLTIDKYGIETVPIYDEEEMVTLMQYKMSNLYRDIGFREGADKDLWAFRWGLNQILAIVITGDDRKEFALQWLEHLLEYKLPMKEWANTKAPWNKPKLNRKPKQILQESINGLEDSYPMITKLCAHEDEIDLWPDFLNASLVGSSAEKELRERRDTRLRMMNEIGNGYWEPSQSETSFDRLRKMEEAENLNFIVSDVDYFSQKMVNINDNLDIYYCPSQGSKRKAWDIIKQINSKVVKKIDLAKEILETHFEKEQKLLQPPRQFRYVDYLIRQFFPEHNIKWYQYNENTSKKGITAGDGCIAIDLDSENVNIRNSKQNLTLSSSDHNFLSQMLIDYVRPKCKISDEGFKKIIKDSSEELPEQIFKIFELECTIKNRYKFISNYCKEELNLSRFQNELENITDSETLELFLSALKVKYKNDDRELQYQDLHLPHFYNGIPSIIQNRNSFAGISNPNNPMSVSRNVPIGRCMVSQLNLISPLTTMFSPNLSGTLGNTLLVNPLEADWFGRFANYHDTNEQYDFSENALSLMKDALTAQWFNPHNNGFILVDEIFIDQDQKRFAGSFHRIHLIHIIASLSCYVEVED